MHREYSLSPVQSRTFQLCLFIGSTSASSELGGDKTRAQLQDATCSQVKGAYTLDKVPSHAGTSSTPVHPSCFPQCRRFDAHAMETHEAGHNDQSLPTLLPVQNCILDQNWQTRRRRIDHAKRQATSRISAPLLLVVPSAAARRIPALAS